MALQISIPFKPQQQPCIWVFLFVDEPRHGAIYVPIKHGQIPKSWRWPACSACSPLAPQGSTSDLSLCFSQPSKSAGALCQALCSLTGALYRIPTRSSMPFWHVSAASLSPKMYQQYPRVSEWCIVWSSAKAVAFRILRPFTHLWSKPFAMAQS